MSLFSVLKKNSRLALRGMWGKAIAVLLITIGASGILLIVRGIAVEIFGGTISFDPGFAVRYGVNEQFFQSLMMTSVAELVIHAVFAVLAVALMAPLSLGTVNFYNRLIHGGNPGVAELFRFFESPAAYGRSLWYYINLSVRCLLWAVLFYAIPGGILGSSTYALMRADASAERSVVAMSSVGLLLAAFLFLLATIFYAATVNRYVLTAYLLCLDDTLTVGKAIKTSVRYTGGYRFSFLLFELSFIGWALLCAFAFPALYVVPYMRASVAMYARYIIEKNNFAPAEATREFVVENPTQAAPEAPAEPNAPAEPPREQENPFDIFKKQPEPPEEFTEQDILLEPGPPDTDRPPDADAAIPPEEDRPQ